MVLHIELPKKDEELKSWLAARGKTHFPALSDDIRTEVANQLITDRKTALNLGYSPPGQAEYLDILRALVTLGKDKDGQLDEKKMKNALNNIKAFALRKHAEEASGSV